MNRGGSMQHRKKYSSLDEIFNDEEFHLIEEKKKISSTSTPDNRLLASFHQVNDFYAKNGKPPEANISNVSEYQLYSRLRSIREDPDKVEMLLSEDIHGLLQENDANMVNEPSEHYSKKPKKEIKSISDILDDDLDILGDDAGLFDFKHTPKPEERASADFVAKRKPCKDFATYEPLFKEVQKDLAEGKRSLIDFKMDNLKEGAFYVHNGVLFLLEHVNISQKEHYREDGTRVREDGRTRCIFENGTQSNMLKRSVEKILYANGKVVTENFEKVNQSFQENFGMITDEDKESGFIYVLKSLNQDPRITSIDNLYKIGYSKVAVEHRIKNAVKEPTYLMAEVDYIAGWKCYNMNTQKFEQLIHNFFGSSCLNIDVFDEKGKRYTPREWFIAPYEVIEQVIGLIISGEVVKYRYDGENEMIVGR
ncbi:GIY-YIG nuclease family protein [Algoriphagus sp. C2-6-M1]|uniref:GIY-YIG nuclease family protein n=1 Tax=Algoriphagus persicinus TaxID=3108754 RepID=UPI002B3AB164|nr:GIY-YIG nuclease family protein [Algoriphagus sp. C2-6-M1]MEB2780763.1 GIY-YIG nuclease family protein [Algoriphagus sp. C2-6-M1]